MTPTRTTDNRQPDGDDVRQDLDAQDPWDPDLDDLDLEDPPQTRSEQLADLRRRLQHAQDRIGWCPFDDRSELHSALIELARGLVELTVHVAQIEAQLDEAATNETHLAAAPSPATASAGRGTITPGADCPSCHRPTGQLHAEGCAAAPPWEAVREGLQASPTTKPTTETAREPAREPATEPPTEPGAEPAAASDRSSSSAVDNGTAEGRS